jgi:serine/threonine protein kinase
MAKVFTITEGLENMGALRTGGQGSVYKGKRMGPIITAVKLLPTPIHTENADDKNFRDFQNEVEKLKKVNEKPSPNVVKILNSGLTESGSLPFIEMEYIEGPDLEDLLKAPHNPVFSIREALKLAEQLAAALAHCHDVGVRHGDIKSNNIKFNTATGNYILLDFGLAVMSDEQRRSSLRNAGAVEFMAPEQYDGKMLFQTDVYSYGIVLYELLAGTVPFPLVNKHESARNMVMVAHIEKVVPDLPELRKAHLPADWSEDKKVAEMLVPGWLLEVIGKCLEKLPEKRYRDGLELYEAVCNGMLSKEEVSGQVVALQSENSVLRNKIEGYERSARSRVLIVAAVLLVVFIGAFAIGSSFNKKGAVDPASKSDVQGPGGRDTLKNAKPAALKQAAETKPADSSAGKNKNANPKKKKKTKDGLVDDVPYF